MPTRSRDALHALAAAAPLALGVAATASVPGNFQYETPCEDCYRVEFVSSDAGATGSLYFLGWQLGDAPITYAASTDGFGLGRFLFSNKNTPSGFGVDLGSLASGATLHFAYIITSGVSVAPTGQVIRSDVGADLRFFGLVADDADARGPYTRVGLEDVVSDASDFDFNDLIFDVRSCQVDNDVPSPGGVALAFAGLALTASRRRPIAASDSPDQPR